MYPETDIPPIIITKEELSEAEKNIPKSWNDSIKELETKYKINPQLAEQIFDSRYIELFERMGSGSPSCVLIVFRVGFSRKIQAMLIV